jgi:hypothetical protein
VVSFQVCSSGVLEFVFLDVEDEDAVAGFEEVAS